MGTNYYARENVCPTCYRQDVLHIGKSSGGWKFSFAGHPHHDPPITSWADWQRFLQVNDLPIEDEHGRSISFDDLYRLVKEKFDSKNCQACYVLDRYPDHDDYHDAEGHPFYPGEFS